MAGSQRTVDFNLHDLVGIRLHDPRPGDVRALARQLGPIQRPLSGPPDIAIRFVAQLPVNGSLRTLGLHEAAFSDDAFLILRSKHKAQARVRVDFQQIGAGPCEIVCESGLPAVPLLIPIVNLTMLSKGVLPLHAAAFTYNGTGVVTTGWSKGGKTEALLAFAARGAAYVGDEWLYLTGDGRRAFGIPEPIRVWDWYLRQLPAVAARVGRGNRLRLAALRGITALHGRAPRVVPGRAARFLERQRYADLHPRDLFPAERLALSGSPDKVVWVVSHDAPAITVVPIEPGEIARRMVHSLHYEWLPFMAWYQMYRFAFPGARNELIEGLEARLATLLEQVLAGKPAYVVAHPYPVDLAALFEAMRPLIEDGGRGEKMSQ
ncbi:MAG: hypothetical protein M5U29_08050 [Anaerolineae bacterium]|nr:hypothetical protein [Anaerolineae bacterium]